MKQHPWRSKLEESLSRLKSQEVSTQFEARKQELEAKKKAEQRAKNLLKKMSDNIGKTMADRCFNSKNNCRQKIRQLKMDYSGTKYESVFTGSVPASNAGLLLAPFLYTHYMVKRSKMDTTRGFGIHVSNVEVTGLINLMFKI